MIKHREQMRVELRDRIRGGDGTLHCVNLLEKAECAGKVNYCAIMTFEPGQSIGLHPHGPDAEIYYLLEGSLEVNDNGVETSFSAGDVMFTSNGENHSVRNGGQVTAKLLAVVIA
jgi:mannose-6-phosphate isomerase-like protein (cupin superfamily)